MVKCVFRFEAAGRQRSRKQAVFTRENHPCRPQRGPCKSGDAAGTIAALGSLGRVALREGRYNIHIHAGGCKALNASMLGKEIIRI
jgi:hypothetical protein